MGYRVIESFESQRHFPDLEGIYINVEFVWYHGIVNNERGIFYLVGHNASNIIYTNPDGDEGIYISEGSDNIFFSRKKEEALTKYNQLVGHAKQKIIDRYVELGETLMYFVHSFDIDEFGNRKNEYLLDYESAINKYEQLCKVGYASISKVLTEEIDGKIHIKRFIDVQSNLIKTEK